ncbi:MAG: hypothetical protein F9B45_15715 [Phycisphaera sp. RhM]|nr:hypothetical protein [Phycisphaera sp. RhM]
MSADRDPLQTIIADFLEAEERGETLDRNAMIDQHQEHADSLRAYFAEHDQMKQAADLEQRTLPPQPAVEEPTLPPQVAEPGEELTLAPSTAPAEPTVGDNHVSESDNLLIAIMNTHFGQGLVAILSLAQLLLYSCSLIGYLTNRNSIQWSLAARSQ